MKKHWCIEGNTGYAAGRFDSQAEAEEKAKCMLAGGRNGDSQIYVYEAVSAIKSPVPNYEVVKL